MKVKACIFSLTLLISSIAFAETFTLSTYYPAPKGSFQQLNINEMIHFEQVSLPPTCIVGDFLVDSSGILRYCSASNVWGYPNGHWTYDDANNKLYTTSYADNDFGLGIGTNDVKTELHIKNTAADAGLGIYLEGNTNSWEFSMMDADNTLKFTSNASGSYGTTGGLGHFLVNTTGTVGFGISTPLSGGLSFGVMGGKAVFGNNSLQGSYTAQDSTLEVQAGTSGTPSSNLRLYANNNNDSLRLSINNTTASIQAFSSNLPATPLTIGINGGNNIHIDANGNVGIATNAPSEGLEVNGSALFRSNTEINTLDVTTGFKTTIPVQGGGLIQAGMVLTAQDNLGNVQWGWPTYAP